MQCELALTALWGVEGDRNDQPTTFQPLPIADRRPSIIGAALALAGTCGDAPAPLQPREAEIRN